MKKIKTIIPAPARSHWVGDGFPVRAVFADKAFTQEISPFLMFDYGGPTTFAPTDKKRGVGPHPHRGFETVTIAYQGEIEHADSVGHRDVIGPGDVQWMTAASGIIHEEMHSSNFSKQGGLFEMAQLWVNLPAKFKMVPPRYQPVQNNDIPVVKLADNAGSARIIAGDFAGTHGAASTFSPINLWDIQLHAGKQVELTVPAGHTTLLFIRHGKLVVDGKTLGPADVALMAVEGERLNLEALEHTSLLLLGGEPIDEPIVAHGPFVMNSDKEIRLAIMDYQSGQMGHMESVS
jgi:redox-sensitive bicupin YhaK (pirin superfamily)